MLKTVKDWIIIILCGVLVLTNFMPQIVEYIYPIIDTKGGNFSNMETDKAVYHCGETPRAVFIFQKQRPIAGRIKWLLVDGPTTESYVYRSREANTPSGIYKEWIAVEPLPDICRPGKYHFEGTLTYPLLFGSVTYPLRTNCFEVQK